MSVSTDAAAGVFHPRAAEVAERAGVPIEGPYKSDHYRY